MPETMEAYTRRIHSYVGGRNPLEMQAAMPSKLATLLTGISADVLRRRPAPNKWSIIEILAHLVDDELVGAYRIRLILGAPGTPIQAFDQDAWAAVGKYTQREVPRLLEEFRVLREMNLALLATLGAAQWQQHGVHAERGIETITDIVSYYAGHDVNHLRQIAAVLGRDGEID